MKTFCNTVTDRRRYSVLLPRSSPASYLLSQAALVCRARRAHSAAVCLCPTVQVALARLQGAAGVRLSPGSSHRRSRARCGLPAPPPLWHVGVQGGPWGSPRRVDLGVDPSPWPPQGTCLPGPHGQWLLRDAWLSAWQWCWPSPAWTLSFHAPRLLPPSRPSGPWLRECGLRARTTAPLCAPRAPAGGSVPLYRVAAASSPSPTQWRWSTA